MKRIIMATILFGIGAGIGYAEEQPIEEVQLEMTNSEMLEETPPLTVAFDTYVNGKKYNRFQAYFGQELTAVQTADGYKVTLTMQNINQIATLTINGLAPSKEENVWTYDVKTLKDIATGEMAVKSGDTRHLYQFDIQFHVPGKDEYQVTPFKDIASYENEYLIGHLFREGVFTAAAKFNPNNPISRSQFSQTLTRAFSFDSSTEKAPFNDIQLLANEATQSITVLWQQGIIKGKSDTIFAPADSVTRRQAAIMLYRVLQIQGVQSTAIANPFKDIQATETEFIRAVATLNELGIMTGSNGQFNPNRILTRHQMAKILYKTMLAVEN